METVILFSSLLFALFALSTQNEFVIKARNAHLPDELSDIQVNYLANLSNIKHIEEVLDNLLVPRVVGTPNHEKVAKYIEKQMEDLGWSVDVDEFQDDTPKFGRLTFRNVVASLNPDAKRFLVLACHYDSKYFEDHEFIGATDSAVPCAMLINMAKVLEKEFAETKERTDLSLKFIFFDGEEAFVNWGPNDSIYGSKHLASKWDTNLRLASDGETVSELVAIDVFVLLDLLGAPDPHFYNFFENTEKWYARLSDAEERLAKMGHLKNYIVRSQPNYFRKRTAFGFIEDDHIPFLKRGVPILHIIPNPFPSVWHTFYDNRKALDMNTIENLNMVMRIFVAEYLHLLGRSEERKNSASGIIKIPLLFVLPSVLFYVVR